MPGPRLSELECIRGAAMLGVVGIHVGSQYLMNPSANVHLVALFEIVTRFSVPIFFFVSAFGMFYNAPPGGTFSYAAFLAKRARAILVPYLVWSAFYIVHYTILFRDTSLLNARTLAKCLFFGYSSYHLYFMVILLWFCLMMPLWIAIVRRISPAGLATLFAIQVAFDYYSSFVLNASGIADPYLRALVAHRLNYWVAHYVFIFVFGGWLAVHFDEASRFMRRHLKRLTALFFASLASLLGVYYYVMAARHYTALEGVNTAHQLCPAGVVYTVAASAFLLALFGDGRFPERLRDALAFLGHHSYFVYLAHPVAIAWLGLALAKSGRVMTAPIAIAFYFAVTGLTLLAAVAMRRLGDRIPLINELSIGVYEKK